MIIAKSAAVLLVNFILYLSFGSFFTVRKGRDWSVPVTVAVGFFAYYALFAVFCLPVMLTYRPLSLLSTIWLIPCALAVLAAAVLFGRAWCARLFGIAEDMKHAGLFWAGVVIVTAVSAALVVMSYNFTLDAAYYVANVATNVDTNMINVYNAFTGSWQDHFELRYAFATYYVNDAVVCQLTGLPALVETKTVMASSVMIIVNMLYVYICRSFFDRHRSAFLMYALMSLMNVMFISIYTASNFLMTRTYEGKSIVGNVSLILIFILFMMLVKNEDEKGVFVKLFVICLGTATVSSTANMVIPAAVGVLFVPYAIIKKKPSVLAKAALCILPEIVMMLLYVLYVKGYYAIYTYPR